MEPMESRGRGNQFPVGWICDVLEQIDRGIDQPDQAEIPGPEDTTEGRDHQPPRSASR